MAVSRKWNVGFVIGLFGEAKRSFSDKNTGQLHFAHVHRPLLLEPGVSLDTALPPVCAPGIVGRGSVTAVLLAEGVRWHPLGIFVLLLPSMPLSASFTVLSRHCQPAFSSTTMNLGALHLVFKLVVPRVENVYV